VRQVAFGRCRLVYEEARKDGYKQREVFTHGKTKLGNNAREDEAASLGKRQDIRRDVRSGLG